MRLAPRHAALVSLALAVLACAGPSGPVRAPEPAATVSAPQPPASPPAPALPPVEGPIGTPHPILVQAVAPDGRWVAACQARADTNGQPGVSVAIGPHGDPYGDALSTYLFVGAGEGVRLDDFLTAEPDGPRVATIEGGALTLRDTRTGATRRVDTGDLAGRGGLVGFDGRGHFVHLRHADLERRQVVVHDIETGAELVLDRGPGRFVHAWVDRTAPWIGVTVELPAAGRYLGRRAPYSTAYRGACRGPASISSSWGGGIAGPTTTRILASSGGPAREVPGLIGLLGGDAIVRRDDLSLWREPLAGGPAQQLVEPACDARVRAVSLASRALLVVCREQRDDGDWALELRGLGAPRPLGRVSQVDRDDPWRGGDVAWKKVFVGGGDTLVDLVRGRAVHKEFARVKYSDGIVAWHGDRVLIRRERGLLWFDLEDGVEHPLPGQIEAYPETYQSGPIVAVEPLVVDLTAGKVLGVMPRPVAVVVATGHLLAPEQPLRPGQEVPDGPLRWTLPEPASLEGAVRSDR